MHSALITRQQFNCKIISKAVGYKLAAFLFLINTKSFIRKHYSRFYKLLSVTLMSPIYPFVSDNPANIAFT